MKFANPILRGFNPDPSLCRVGDDYYIATSTFEWFPGVQIHHSNDLENWTLVSRPLTRAAQLDMRGNPDSCGIWAPSLSYADGLFWLIYTNVRRYDGNYKDAPNYLVTAADITGPWSDPVYLNASGFDPSMFHDDDGKRWLVNMRWNHRASMKTPVDERDWFGGIDLQEYDHDKKKLVGNAVQIFDRSDLGFTEAPHIFKRRGYYYLITAEGGTGYTHAVTHARSKTIDGPYELHPDTHVLTAKDTPDNLIQRVGHGQPADGPDDGSVLHTFLCNRPLDGNFSPLGRETGITLLKWGDDDWMYREGGPAPEAAAGTDPADIGKTKEVSVFSPAGLPLPFQWLRSPEPDTLFSSVARPGWLRLIGRESIGSWFEQSLVARRQTEHVCTAEVTIDYTPETYLHQAGLVAYYNRHQFHYLYLTVAPSGDRQLTIQSCNGDWPEGKLTFPIDDGVAVPDGPLRMGLEINSKSLQFFYSIGSGAPDWHKIGPVLDASVLSDEGGRGEHANFTGCFLGMAAQDMSGHGHVADFKDFTYLTGQGLSHG